MASKSPEQGCVVVDPVNRITIWSGGWIGKQTFTAEEAEKRLVQLRAGEQKDWEIRNPDERLINRAGVQLPESTSVGKLKPVPSPRNFQRQLREMSWSKKVLDSLRRR